MTLLEIKNQVMFQTNNDEDDIDDYIPFIGEYVNDGYDRLVKAYDRQHVVSTNSDYPPLTEDEDIPLTPDWTHRYLCDWATWLIYRNGNPQKQQRGMAFRESFMDCLRRIQNECGKSGETNGVAKKFFNIPK
jgi:hypothetical protein